MQLFISDAHQSIDSIRPIVEVLTAGGHFAWFDDQLLPGQDWKIELRAAIERSDALVFAMTPISVSSEWCRWELAVAAEAKKAVIPLLLEQKTHIASIV